MKHCLLPAGRLWIICLLTVFAFAAGTPGRAQDSLRRSVAPQDTTRRALADSLAKAVKDSLPLRDSLLLRDSLPLQDSIPLRDSLFLKDSIPLQDSLSLHDSLQLSPKELLKQQRRAVRDSVRAVRDSLQKIPRMMESFYFPDSLHYKRIIAWTHERYLNDPSMSTLDTLANNTIHDYAFLKHDVGATYLGVSGSATLYHNYFKRQRMERFEAYDPYLSETFTPETMPFYNTKSPYTELSYAGTLFANKQKEETNIEVIHTQNLSPEFNFSLNYKRFGGNGMLPKESTNTRSFTIGLNYIGKRYIMHGGYIYNKVRRTDNGGTSDESLIRRRDTTVDVRTVPVYLQNANSEIKNNTFFITQMYGIPIRLLKSDTLAVGEGTTMYLGHAGTFATYSRFYRDEIALSDTVGRAFYHNNFYYHPTTTLDSLRTRKIDNRFFIRLQPWAKNAIVSKIDGGVGYEYLSNYTFSPEYYLTGTNNHIQNNIYFYAGASGIFRKYFEWNALGRLDFAGYYQGDMMLQGDVRFSAYPIEQGVHLLGNFSMQNRTPDWYDTFFSGNHHRWNNDFDKITETRISATLSIPKWKLEAFFGYGMLTNTIYYDTLGLPKQSGELLNVMTASLTKNFKLWKFHFDNRILVQFSSNQDIIPLPLVSANLRYYLEFTIVKNVLTAQLGADVTYNTEYYAPAYDPDTGHFRIQNERKIGNNPYIDAFVNLTWKRATIFVKYVNAAMPWPDGDYFSALHYIRPQTAVKFGMTWPFYIRPQSKI